MADARPDAYVIVSKVLMRVEWRLAGRLLFYLDLIFSGALAPLTVIRDGAVERHDAS